MKQVSQRYEDAVPVNRLKPHPLNANSGARAVIAESIEENGFYGAVYAHEGTGYIVAGNHRWEEAVKKGAETLPVIWLDVDEKRAAKLLAVDNRSGRLGRDDDAKLADLLESFAGDFAGTGYGQENLDGLLRDLGRLADTNTEFLSGFGGAGGGAADHEPTIGVGAWVPLAFSLTPEDRECVVQWLKRVQNEEGLDNTAEALVHVARCQ